MRFLILDDDSDTVDCYRRLFDSMGISCDFFTDSEKAEIALRSTPYQCVVTDLMMPGVNGLSLVRRLRDGTYGHFNHETPIIVATSFDNNNARDALLSFSRVAVVGKVLTREQVTDLIRELVG